MKVKIPYVDSDGRTRDTDGATVRLAVHEAIVRLNQVGWYSGGILVKSETVRQRGYDFTIRMADSRRHGTSVRKWHEAFGMDARMRRSVHACWHTHRDVFAAVFARHPMAVITSGLRGDIRYEGRVDFYDSYPATGRWSVGSIADPLHAIDACLCGFGPTDYAPGVMMAITDGFVPLSE